MAKVIFDLDFNEYLSIDRISSSDLITISKDPILYYYNKVFKVKETSSMNFGKKLHLALLEEEKFNNLELLKSSTTIKDGCIGTLEKDYIKEIQNIIFDDNLLKDIFKNSKRELTILWEYEDIKLKSRLDLIKLNKNSSIILDVKTTCFNNEDDILRAIDEYKYLIQAKTYIKAFKKGFDIKDNIYFYFLFCTKKPPFNVFVYKVDTLDDIEFKSAIKLYKDLPSFRDLKKGRVRYLDYVI